TEAAGPPGALGGTIRISSGDGDRVWVRVEDDGVGIPAERLERIFDPFYSTKPSQGMGLGLNECRRIVDLYGGEIQAETEVGRGTRFTVLWPPGEPAAEDPGAPKVTP
ncbi:MAG: sensor histidine kinase, partial [Nitrospinota bacterium]